MEQSLFRLKKSCISIQKSSPFFAYLSLFLKFKEVKSELKWEDGGLGAGVTIKGDFIYNPSFIESLSDEELKGVILHEISHLVFLHHTRLGNRNQEIFNIASDICVNSLLKINNFRLPNGVILPDNNNEVELFKESKHKQIIKKCGEKSAEQIYDEIKIPKEFQKEFYSVSEEGKELGKQSEAYGKSGYKQIDKHFYDKGELSEEERRKIEKEWIQRVQEAYVQSQMRGVVPAGIERIIGNLFESKIRWKALLQKYIQQSIQDDFTYSRPHKKSISTGFFMPDAVKEKINISVIIDVSGSIGQDELTAFLSEIVSIAKAFRNRISMTLYTHETEINDSYKVENGSISKILSLKIRGGGGTAHEKVFEFLNNRALENKLCIFLTDGYSDLANLDFRKNRFESIFVISKGGDESCIREKKVRIIKLDK